MTGSLLTAHSDPTPSFGPSPLYLHVCGGAEARLSSVRPLSDTLFHFLLEPAGRSFSSILLI